MTRPVTYTVAHTLLPLNIVLDLSCGRNVPVHKINAFILSDGSTGIEEKSFAKMIGYTHDRFIRLYRGHRYQERFLYKLIMDPRLHLTMQGEFSHIHAFVDTPCQFIDQEIVVVPSRVCTLISHLFAEARQEGVLKKVHKDIALRCRNLRNVLASDSLHSLIYHHCGLKDITESSNVLYCLSKRYLSLHLAAMRSALRDVYPDREDDKYDKLCATIISYAYKYVLGDKFEVLKKARNPRRSLVEHLSDNVLDKVKFFLACFAYEMQREHRLFCWKYKVSKQSHEEDVQAGRKACNGRVAYSPIRDGVKLKVIDVFAKNNRDSEQKLYEE